jgi:sulfur-oxidizing protein SoxY
MIANPMESEADMPANDPILRRTFLRAGGLLAAALALGGVDGAAHRLAAGLPPAVGGPDDPPIPNDVVRKIMADRFQDRTIQRGHMTLDMPTMAEDGRYVPVALESDLPMTSERYVQAVYLIVDHNPDPLVTVFHLTPAIAPVQIQTRIKMKRTSWIRAIAETSNGELWADYLKVETTLNGCG